MRGCLQAALHLVWAGHQMALVSAETNPTVGDELTTALMKVRHELRCGRASHRAWLTADSKRELTDIIKRAPPK